MRLQPYFRALPLFLILTLFACIGACEYRPAKVKIQLTQPDGSVTPSITAEVVSTRQSRQLGLQYRKQMAPDAGMLFVFPKEELQSFWMKNTYLELDIIYLDKDLRVVHVVERAEPLTETARPSRVPALYVLEVLGGSAKSWGVVNGSKATVTGVLPIGTK